MAKLLIDLTVTGLTVNDIEFDWCKQLSDNTDVTVSGVTSLLERGSGYYILEVPVSTDSDFRVYETTTSGNYAATGILTDYSLETVNTSITDLSVDISNIDTKVDHRRKASM